MGFVSLRNLVLVSSAERPADIKNNFSAMCCPPPIRVIAVAIAFVIDLVMPVLETRTGYPAGGQVTEAGLGSNIGGTPVSTWFCLCHSRSQKLETSISSCPEGRV